MGEVYLARSASSRLVAVKTIRAELAVDPGYRRRFAFEVAAARRVSGAFTAAVVDADADAESPWLATVYVPAPSLAELVRVSGPMPVAAIHWLAAGCAEALECVHRAGLVHRDLKPANILVTADGPRVIDFGLARTDDNPHRTVIGALIGTPSYMAPEQAAGESRGPAVDIFALGATLTFAATGRPPYRATSAKDVILQLLTGEPDLSDVPEVLREMLTACLARNPADRPTPAQLLAYNAPHLVDTGATSPPLPARALSQIEEHAQLSHPPAAIRSGEQGGRTAFGEDTERESGRDARPAHPSLPAGRASHRRTQRRAPWSLRGVRLYVLLTAVAILALAGLTAGTLIGTSGPGQTDAAGNTPTVEQNPTSPGPFPGEQPRRPPPPPGAIDQINGQILTVDPPIGDPNTVFVLHCTGWPAGRAVTVSLVGGRSVPAGSVDGGGNFTYTVNQQHELFAGPIPPGVHRIRATAGSLVETVDIVIDSVGGPQPTNP
jgi:serine/threonine protein kinase